MKVLLCILIFPLIYLHGLKKNRKHNWQRKKLKQIALFAAKQTRACYKSNASVSIDCAISSSKVMRSVKDSRQRPAQKKSQQVNKETDVTTGPLIRISFTRTLVRQCAVALVYHIYTYYQASGIL